MLVNYASKPRIYSLCWYIFVIGGSYDENTELIFTVGLAFWIFSEQNDNNKHGSMCQIKSVFEQQQNFNEL